jgi:hypothetical protein
MTRLAKTLICGLAAASVVTVASVQQAEAQRRGAVGAAIVGGLIVGGIVAGAAAANARERTYYRSEGCGYFARRAQEAEYNGRYGRARGWWDRYESCRAGY